MSIRFTLILSLAFISCNAFSDQQDRKYQSPKGYKLTEPHRYRVRESMQEISGIVLNPDERHIYSINDEQGKIFDIDVNTDKPYPTTKFGKSGDYEDLVNTNQGWFVLKSNGILFQVHDMFTDSVSATEYKLSKKGKQEFESVYVDTPSNSVIMICKDCPEDKNESVSSAYRFRLDNLEFDTEAAYHLSVDDIEKLAGIEINHFRPSAAAMHPIEHRLYIISSINRLLVIASREGKIQEVYHLKRKLFQQPEGISFAPNGDMYVSNEAGDGVADILKFSYKP
jgi:uncharacterized protein YjiK